VQLAMSSSLHQNQRAPSQRLTSTGGLKELPFVVPSHELVSRARKLAFKVREDTTIKNSRQRARKVAALKIDTLTKELSVPLRSLVEGYRRQLRRLHPFEAVVSDLTVRALEKSGKGTLQEILDEVKAVHKEVVSTGKAAAAEARNASRAMDAAALAEDGMDRTCRVLEEAAPLLMQMLEVQKALRRVPVVELTAPTVVLVGAPNVGKSSIINAISTGTPEINNYPFTTRGMTLGHMFDDVDGFQARYQVMDTPGVLARPDGDRNEMESLTIASMLHLPTAVMFVFDLTGLSGDDKSSIEDQFVLRQELRRRFPKRPWLDVVSKADLEAEPGALEKLGQVRESVQAESEDFIHVSVVNEQGLEELKDAVQRMHRAVSHVLVEYQELQEEIEMGARQQRQQGAPRKG